MTKKNFIALADHIREHNRVAAIKGVHILNYVAPDEFTKREIESLADFCQSQNPRFNRERWLSYIAGKCGPNGGAL